MKVRLTRRHGLKHAFALILVLAASATLVVAILTYLIDITVGAPGHNYPESINQRFHLSIHSTPGIASLECSWPIHWYPIEGGFYGDFATPVVSGHGYPRFFSCELWSECCYCLQDFSRHLTYMTQLKGVNISISLWLLASLELLTAVLMLFRMRRKPGPRDCLSCSYNLTGNTTG